MGKAVALDGLAVAESLALFAEDQAVARRAFARSREAAAALGKVAL